MRTTMISAQTSAAPEKQRILVVDDDRGLTDFVRRGLAHEGYAVEAAHDGRAGLRRALEQPPDLLILDVMLPGIDGLEVCRLLKDERDTPVLMLTARDSIADRVLGLETGADDYLVKPFAFSELLARIRVRLRRKAEAAPPEVLRYGDLTLDHGKRAVHCRQRAIPLSTTEYNLLRLFLQHPRQVLAREQIIDRVWSADFAGESNVLEVYIRFLRRKLEEDGGPRLIHTVRGAGYVLRD